VQLAIYKLLYRADRPLTFAEICDQLAQTTHYQNDANRAYGESGIPETKYLDKIKGNWDADILRDAWEWWVDYQLNLARMNKRIITTRADGTPVTNNGQWGHMSREDKAWTANRDHPPIVEARPITVGGVQFYPERKRVAWSPDQDELIERENGRRRFLNEAEKLLQHGQAKQVSIDRDILAGGVKALS
jgi:hypothetical protein